MFRNKHLIAAMLIAPILALVAYFGVDAMVSEKPMQAEAGQSYALVAMPQCRYSSGHCTLKNSDFKVEIKPLQVSGNSMVLKLHSVFPLQAAKIALVQNPNMPGSPSAMHAIDDKRQDWRITIQGAHEKTSQLRLVVIAKDAYYYGETGLEFLTYATSFGEADASQ